MPARLLVCGGRTFGIVPLDTPAELLVAEKARARYQRRLLDATLDKIRAERGVSIVIHGGQAGADRLAGKWAVRNGVPVLPFIVTPLEWKRLGKAAGPIRNGKMIREGRPDLVVAFRGGSGTLNMVAQSYRSGIEVIEVERDPPF